MQVQLILQVHHNPFIFWVLVHYNSTVYQHVGNHLVTCPYCILWTDTSITKSQDGTTKEGRNLYLFSKLMSHVPPQISQI